MSGYWGSFKSTLDTKGRINFPARFRKNLVEEDADTVILIRGSERWIGVYPLTAWNETVEELKNKVASKREFAIVSRRLMFDASEQKVDKQGRLNLTANLIDYAQLTSEILIVGYDYKMEIWDPQRYQRFVENTEPDFQSIARDMDF